MEREVIPSPSAITEAPPGGSIVVYVVLVELTPNTVSITMDTDSWIEAVVKKCRS